MTADRIAQTDGLVLDFGAWGFDTRGWSPSTARQYRLTVRRAAESLARQGLDLERCTPEELRGWFSGIKPTAAARNQVRKAIRAYFAFLVDTGRRDDDPSEAFARLREPLPVPRSLALGAAVKFVRAAEVRGPEDRALTGVLLFAALRASEAAALAWSEVDDGWLRFHGKGGKERNVPLHVEAARALSAWKAQCPSSHWVFPSPVAPWDHIGYHAVRERVKAIADAAGLEGVTPHVLRHSGATALLDSGADLMDVKEVLGHASVATTQRYLKVRPRRLKDAVARLDFSADTLAIGE